MFSPREFRRWAGVSLVAAAAERRIWVQTGGRQTFPNMYIFLVASPGVGKQIIDDVRDLCIGVTQEGKRILPLHVSPNSMTKAAMVDEIVKAEGQCVGPGGQTMEYHSLYTIEEEAQVLMPAYDSDFLGIVNKLYNNPQAPLTEVRRHGPVREVCAALPQLNLLLGVQPGWMAGTFPELAWSTGLMSRVIMIYVEEAPNYDFFGQQPDTRPLHRALQKRLLSLARRFGAMEWAPEAIRSISDWSLGGRTPLPTHSKLGNYNARRPMHLTKLALICALSRGADRWVELEDLARAKAWLFEAEGEMPGIFRAMTGKSDMAVIEELHFYLTSLWTMSKGKAIHQSALYNFLTRFVPGEKVERLIQVAERAGVVARVAGTDTYMPRPKHQHGVE